MPTPTFGRISPATLVFTMLGMLAIAGLTGPRAGASDLAVDHVSPRLDRAVFGQFVQRMGLDSDQRMVVEIVYSDYASSFDHLLQQTDARADAAGRQRVSDALSGKIFVEPSELRRLRMAVEQSYQAAWPEADELLENLLDNVLAMVPDEQFSAFDEALVPLRRAVYLTPRRRHAMDEKYAGDGVDVLVLYAEAQREELAGLPADHVADVLAEYAHQLDAVLLETHAADRQGRGDAAVARIERDAGRMRDEERAALVRWQRLYVLNQQAVKEIGDAAAHAVGAEAQARWMDRFDRARFPRMFDETLPEKQAAWIARRKLGPEVAAQVDDVMSGYIAAHAEAGRDAIAMMRRARLSFKSVIHARTNPSKLGAPGARELYQNLLKNSGRRAQIAEDASAKLEAMLTSKQRRQMKADIAAAAFGRRR